MAVKFEVGDRIAVYDKSVREIGVVGSVIDGKRLRVEFKDGSQYVWMKQCRRLKKQVSVPELQEQLRTAERKIEYLQKLLDDFRARHALIGTSTAAILTARQLMRAIVAMPNVEMVGFFQPFVADAKAWLAKYGKGG